LVYTLELVIATYYFFLIFFCMFQKLCCIFAPLLPPFIGKDKGNPSIVEGFFLLDMNKKKVIVYVDGFNFYFGLRSKNWRKFYWLDIVKFAEKLLRPHQELVEVNYFSARHTNPDKSKRQDRFFQANKLNPKFTLHLTLFHLSNALRSSIRHIKLSLFFLQTELHST